jgi:hypothetical protein
MLTAGRALKLHADFFGVKVKLEADIEIFLLFYLERFVVVENPLEILLEVLDVDTGALLVILQRFYTI